MVSVVVFMYDNVLQNGRSVKFCDGRSRQIGREPSSIYGLPWFSLQQHIKHNVCIKENTNSDPFHRNQLNRLFEIRITGDDLRVQPHGGRHRKAVGI